MPDRLIEITSTADRNSAAHIRVAGGAVPEREEFSQAVKGFAGLRKRYWGQHLWARSYWVATSGNVTDEVWKRYIEKQRPPDCKGIKLITGSSLNVRE
jgi:REP element-mobilizing transposase RayT